MVDPVLVGRVGEHVAVVTLNRPEARNAVDPGLARGLVGRLVAPGSARDEAVALATEIAGNAPLAVRESLAVARLAPDADEAGLRAASAAARAPRPRRMTARAPGPSSRSARRPEAGDET